jgi:cyclophilin family peptidyl-prolyl cis-trans isomerase
MKQTLVAVMALCIYLCSASCSRPNTKIALQTTMGEIQIELYDSLTPATVKNFLAYADNGFYEGTIFHRVIPDFMIQGGGFTADMKQKITREPIANEAKKELSNERGTIAMARTGAPHSATAQFFINLKNNNFLDRSARDLGYCVFGRVISGMNVVDAISSVPRHNENFLQDVPDEPVVIIAVSRM